MTQVIRMCTENHVIILLGVILGSLSQLPVLPRSDIWAPPPIECIKHSGNSCQGGTVTFQAVEFSCGVRNPETRKVTVSSLISDKKGGGILI